MDSSHSTKSGRKYWNERFSFANIILPIYPEHLKVGNWWIRFQSFQKSLASFSRLWKTASTFLARQVQNIFLPKNAWLMSQTIWVKH